MRALIRVALSMPPHVAAERAARWVVRRMRGIMAGWWARQRPSYPPLHPQAGIAHGLRAVPPVSGVDDLLGHWKARRFNLLGSGWVSVDLAAGVGGIMAQCWPVDRARVAKLVAMIDDADYRPIDWHVDFKSGYRWDPRGWGPSSPYGHQDGVDIKVPWELARMGHLLTMAQAYADAPRDRLAADIRNQILDFAAANPPGWGVNWACAMDVGFRIAAILTAYDCLATAGWKADAPFVRELAALTLAHGRFIRAHLEPGGNHYLGNLCGLILAGSYLTGLPEAAQWTQFAVPEMERQVMAQFLPDGGNYEGSTAYHRLSLEMVQKTLTAIPSDEVRDRLQRAIQFARDCTLPSGRAVQVGDNDSGRFLNFDPKAGEMDFSHLWRGEDETTPAYAAAPSGPKPGGTARTITTVRFVLPDDGALQGLTPFAYPDFGLYGWKNARAFIALRCGPIGQNGRGGHAHNDQLAVEIEIDGTAWARDPGTYLYTPDLAARNRYRSVLAHFAPRDGTKEPARFLAPFQLEDSAQARLIEFSAQTMAGAHQGFGGPVMRIVTLGPEGLAIQDWLGGSVAGAATQRIDHVISSPSELRRAWGLDIPFSPGYGLQDDSQT